jgi:hypothetical protein
MAFPRAVVVRPRCEPSTPSPSRLNEHATRLNQVTSILLEHLFSHLRRRHCSTASPGRCQPRPWPSRRSYSKYLAEEPAERPGADEGKSGKMAPEPGRIQSLPGESSSWLGLSTVEPHGETPLPRVLLRMSGHGEDHTSPRSHCADKGRVCRMLFPWILRRAIHGIAP